MLADLDIALQYGDMLGRPIPLHEGPTFRQYSHLPGVTRRQEGPSPGEFRAVVQEYGARLVRELGDAVEWAQRPHLGALGQAALNDRLAEHLDTCPEVDEWFLTDEELERVRRLALRRYLEIAA